MSLHSPRHAASCGRSNNVETFCLSQSGDVSYIASGYARCTLSLYCARVEGMGRPRGRILLERCLVRALPLDSRSEVPPQIDGTLTRAGSQVIDGRIRGRCNCSPWIAN